VTLAAENGSDEVARLEARLAEANARIAELDATNEALESEMVRRGVNLRCTRVALSRAQIAVADSTPQRARRVRDRSHAPAPP